MTVFVALLRAVNVGGTGKLAMSTLTALCEAAGFVEIRTYIASGNVVFHGDAPAAAAKRRLEAGLEAYAGRPVGVLLRSAAEMAEIAAGNPFPRALSSRTVAMFLESPPGGDALAGVTGRKDEEIRLGKREIYVHYPDGIGRSRLKIPAAAAGTARNMNTVARLAELAATP